MPSSPATDEARRPVGDLADPGAGRVAHAARAVPFGGLGPRDRDSRQLVGVPVLDDVDDAPVGELAHDEIRDPRESSLLLERRGELVAHAAEEVEPCLALGDLGRRGTLGRRELLALVLGPSQLAEIAEEALHVHGLPGRVADERALLAHPDGPAVAREQAVVEPRRGLLRRLREHALAVLGMDSSKRPDPFAHSLGEYPVSSSIEGLT